MIRRFRAAYGRWKCRRNRHLLTVWNRGELYCARPGCERRLRIYTNRATRRRVAKRVERLVDRTTKAGRR